MSGVLLWLGFRVMSSYSTKVWHQRKYMLVPTQPYDKVKGSHAAHDALMLRLSDDQEVPR